MSRFHWVNRADVIYPNEDYRVYRLYKECYWVVNELGDFLFWGETPQCNKSEDITKSVLTSYRNDLDEPATVVFIDRAWVPVPRSELL